MKHTILIHGNSLSSQTFKPQLNDNNLTSALELHVIDLPGHGEAPRLDRYSLGCFIGYIIDRISDLDLSEVGLVGHSLGGHLAIDLLSGDLPFDISRMLIFGTPPLKSPVDMSAFHSHPAVASAFTSQLSEDEADVLASTMGTQDLKELILQADPQVRADIGGALTDGSTLDEVGLLAGFKGKLAVVHGAEDALVSLDYIEALNLDLWQDKVHIIKGAGHSPQYEKPGDFNHLVKAFFTD